MPKTSILTSYKCSNHFKATAVRLSDIMDIAIRNVAKSLYIHPDMLSRWRKEMREGNIVAKRADVDKAVSGEIKELRRIEKAYERLKLEHDLLQKAIELTSKFLRFSGRRFGPQQMRGDGTNLRRLMISISLFVSLSSNASPCDSLDVSLSKEDATTFAPYIAKQLNASSTEIKYSMRSSGWRVLYVEPHNMEPAFLFYSGSPTTNTYVELWAGMASPDELSEIESWVISNVKGIPEPLAHCFAWHVTEGLREL